MLVFYAVNMFAKGLVLLAVCGSKNACGGVTLSGGEVVGLGGGRGQVFTHTFEAIYVRGSADVAERQFKDERGMRERGAFIASRTLMYIGRNADRSELQGGNVYHETTVGHSPGSEDLHGLPRSPQRESQRGTSITTASIASAESDGETSTRKISMSHRKGIQTWTTRKTRRSARNICTAGSIDY